MPLPGTGADDDDDAAGSTPPEPMAEPAPPPSVPVAASGSRLRRFVLPERRQSPPAPLEVTVRTSYPEEEVRVAAYYRFLERERVGTPGDETSDWVTAEREVLGG